MLAVLLSSPAAAEAGEAGLRPDAPPGVALDDPDRGRFLAPPQPLRSFEEDAEGWSVETWPDAGEARRGGGIVLRGEPVLVEAEITGERASDGARSLVIPARLPGEAVVVKRARLGEYRYVAYDLFVPPDATGRVRSIFFAKNKDGVWFQSLSARPFVRGASGALAPGASDARLVPGAWNTVTVDLRGRSNEMRPPDGLARWREAHALEADVIGFAVTGDAPYEGRFLLDNIRGWALDGSGAGPLEVRNLSFATIVGRWSVWEATFDLSRAFVNPFDPEEAEVEAEFAAPSGRTARVPGFLYQDFERRLTPSGEELAPSGGALWKVRFAPMETGTCRFRLFVRAGADRLVTGERSFEVAQSSERGFVRVSARDPRCFEFDDGTPYYPVGHNYRSPNDPRCSLVLGWPVPTDEGTFAYDRTMRRMAAAGENFVEIWMASWWVGIEWTYDWKGYLGLGRYNLGNAWRLDHVLRTAHELGIRVQLVIDNHGKYSAHVDPEWQFSPYGAGSRPPAGFEPGFLQSPDGFFTDDRAKKLYKRKARYILARWAAFSTIMGFEMVSELNLVGRHGGFAGRKRELEGEGAPLRVDHLWHREMIGFCRTLDPCGHLYTTHYSGDCDTVDPMMARLPEISYVVGDGYRGGESPFAHLALRTASCHEPYGKPFMITEYGCNWNGGSEAALEADLHSGLWATWMTSAGGTPLLWWFDLIDRRDLYRHFRAFAAYAAGEDRRDPAFRMTRPSVSGEGFEKVGRGLSAMAYVTPSRGYAWVCSAEAMTRYPKEPVRIDGVRFTLSGLDSGTWKVEFWDTIEGLTIGSRMVEAKGGALEVDLPAFANDLALKFRRATRLSGAQGR